jgi:serine/threonine-protein kinase
VPAHAFAPIASAFTSAKTLSGSSVGAEGARAFMPSLQPRFCPTCQGRYPADFKVCPRDATPLEDAPSDRDPMLGLVLADTFHIVRLIGEGGMGRVYEARHVRLPNKRFAVKVLLPHHAQSADVVTRFQREAEAASGIGHPNVVDVYDVHHTPEGVPYLVCEYLEGTDFSTLLDQRDRVPVALAVFIVRQVCRALAAAHARGIVHRDVKPENVFLVGDPASPIVKVIDFGISKVDAGGGASLTRTGMIMGTPGYMAPEQARGARVDHRADIYGVGAILYRALTGQLPFDSDDAAETLSAVLTQDPPRPRSIEPSIPPALELVIERAMAKAPEDRYGTLAELDAELEAFEGETGSPLPVREPSSPLELSGAAHATAPTLLSTGPLPTGRKTLAVERATREAQWARPTIIALTAFAYFWVAALVLDALASLVRATKGEGLANSTTETWLVVLGVAATSVTPLVFWLRFVKRNVWGNSVRSVDVASMLRRVVLTSSVAYGIASLVLRVLDTAVIANLNPGGPLWSPLLLAVALGAGTVAHLVFHFRRKH